MKYRDYALPFYLSGKFYSRAEFAGIFGVTWGTIRRKQRKGMDTAAIVAFYEKKHGKNYRRTTSTLKEALTSLATWWHNEKTSFLRVAEVIGGDNG